MSADAFANIQSQPPAPRGYDEIWIDVGAHLGEKTFACAQANPGLCVYAFEPLAQTAERIRNQLPNYIVFQMAVCESDGLARFYVNDFDAASSLLPLESEGLRSWKGGEVLKVSREITVPTMRLDTFMDKQNIRTVNFLKVDAQGADLAVIRSAGRRIADIQRINLEVQITPKPLYRNSSQRGATISYLEAAGFSLESVQKQSHEQEENLTFIRRN